MNEPPVVVAGGGIAGLAAALAVARAGRDVLVFERDANRSEEGAGLQLSPNASRHLREWGVLERLDATALAPDAAVVRRGSDARQLVRLDLSDARRRFGAPFRVAHRADLLAALADAVSGESRIKMQAGIRVTGWRGGEALVVETEDGEQPASACIVADGVHSTLRQRILPGPLIASRRTAWRTLIPADACEDFARASASNLWLGRDAHLVHYPLRGGSVVNVVAIVAQGLSPRERGRDDAPQDSSSPSWSRAGDPADLAERFASWSPSVRTLLGAAKSWRVWPLFSRPAPARLAKGRVALAGDAAHPMMPFLAQGAAQAIEDAAALGDAFARHDDTTSALRACEQTRLRRVKRVVAASERQAAIYHLGGTAAVARDIAMEAAGQAGLRFATDWIYRG